MRFVARLWRNTTMRQLDKHNFKQAIKNHWRSLSGVEKDINGVVDGLFATPIGYS